MGKFIKQQINLTVSVVIPTIGRESIIQAIQSVIDQTIICHEIIVIKDRCNLPVFNFQTRIPIKIFQSDFPGVSNARNLGIEKATGQYVALLDDDDLWVSNKIEKQLDILLEDLHNKKDYIVSCRVMRQNSLNLSIQPKKLYLGGKISTYLYELSWMPTKKAVYTLTLLIPTSLARSIRFNPELKNREDIDFLIRAQQHGAQIHQLIDVLCLVRDNKSRSWNRENLSSLFLWTRYLIRFDLRSAFCYFFGVGMRTLVLKYLYKLMISVILIGKFKNSNSSI